MLEINRGITGQNRGPHMPWRQNNQCKRKGKQKMSNSYEPLKLRDERVWRTYTGGREIRRLHGGEGAEDDHTSEAVFDIQYGNVKRPTHANISWDFARFEVCVHKWLELGEDDYGVSFINDCKYRCSVKVRWWGCPCLSQGPFPILCVNAGPGPETHGYGPGIIVKF